MIQLDCDEEYLVKYDAQPTLFPTGMPVSSRMAWVAVVELDETYRYAVQIETEADLQQAADPNFANGKRKLFFCVPTSILAAVTPKK